MVRSGMTRLRMTLFGAGLPPLLALTGLALGACSTDVSRFSVPKPAYAITRSGPEDQDFVRQNSTPPSTRTEPVPSDEPPAPQLRGRQSPGPTMPVRSAPPPALETPAQVVVRPGESVFEVAERVRTPIRAIIDLNNLQPPYDVTPGSVLRIPPPVVYTVRAGDTLAGVGKRFSIDPRSLANLNDIQLETSLRPGQRLALPSLVKDRGPGAAATGPQVAASLAPTRSISAATRPTIVKPTFATTAAIKPPVTKAAPATEPETDSDTTQVAAIGKGKFVWPVKGEIISGYGPKGPGQRNDGINIAATAGDPVKAAAAGQVVYAGNSVPGFGNLVVIKHDGGWTSLYGNLGKMSVKIRAEVAQGQDIGSAGVSGAVDRPQVHFELRYAPSPAVKARPLDPATLLP